jgi:ABC-2 type transport system permease protein
MRNTWLIIRREYLERVRTRSFVVLTLLLPAIMTGVMILPAKLATLEKKPRIVVVTSTPQFGETVRQGLLSASHSRRATAMMTRRTPKRKTPRRPNSSTSSMWIPMPPRRNAQSCATKSSRRPSTATFG